MGSSRKQKEEILKKLRIKKEELSKPPSSIPRTTTSLPFAVAVVAAAAVTAFAASINVIVVAYAATRTYLLCFPVK